MNSQLDDARLKPFLKRLYTKLITKHEDNFCTAEHYRNLRALLDSATIEPTKDKEKA